MTVKVDVPNYANLVANTVAATKQRALVEVENEARLTAPVDSNAYRNNIQRNLPKSEVVANIEYSAAIEYGFNGTSQSVSSHTRKVKGKVQNVKAHTRIMNREPNPVMRNAARKIQNQIGAIFVRELKKRV